MSVGIDLQPALQPGLVDTANLEMLKEIAETSTPNGLSASWGFTITTWK
ncbi:hypothetical protein [Paraflavitalea speifideaquila]|nr:hypothetical protein [Paraflavitalea speifideiaquila]